MNVSVKALLLCLVVLISGVVQAQEASTPLRKLSESIVALSDEGSPVLYVAWSPDGNYLVALFPSPDFHTMTNNASLFDAATGELLYENLGFVAWYADSSRVLVLDEALRWAVLNVKTRETIIVESGKFGLVDDMLDRFIYDDIILGSTGMILNIYDAYTGTLTATLTDVIERPYYSEDLSQAAISKTGSVDIYDTATWALVDSLPGYTLAWRERQWSADNRHLIVYPQENQRPFFPRYIWTVGEGLSLPIYNLDSLIWWSADSTQMAEANDAEIRFFDSTTGERISTVRGLPLGNTSIMAASDEYMVLKHVAYEGYATGASSISVLNLRTRQIVYRQDSYIFFVQLFGDMLYVFEYGAFIKKIDLAGGTAPVAYPIPYSYSALNADKEWVLARNTPSFEDASIGIFQLEPFTEYVIATAPPAYESLNFKWSPDGRRFAVFRDVQNRLTVWEISE